MGTVLAYCKFASCECSEDQRVHCDAKLEDARRAELFRLSADQAHDMEHGTVFCTFTDALLMDSDIDHVGVHFADDRPEAARILDAEGFDHTTGCDTALDTSHAGAMICAGFALMEHDDVDPN